MPTISSGVVTHQEINWVSAAHERNDKNTLAKGHLNSILSKMLNLDTASFEYYLTRPQHFEAKLAANEPVELASVLNEDIHSFIHSQFASELEEGELGPGELSAAPDVCHDAADLETVLVLQRRRQTQGGRRKDKVCVVQGCQCVTGDVKRHLRQFHGMDEMEGYMCLQAVKDDGCR